ncbi:uncharacterized protein BP5553_07351 [Venustampulla echinocandica]|uniref:FAD-binding PCMH-type domain-containing protein n=1 Tax=Venustampulla echinocandica TaxID=2656787 RepID=A0A370TJ99_9HELO|nr:uncharacterized protein BP5553_07351 [Venustampulla echinocandica]RDL35420.1 hypothetical protein BP5553_07351 [Venustampulla echinocandica]
MLEIDEQAHLKNLTIVSGGAGTVGVGGYLTGGGHGALSSTYGMAADQVLEMEIVTPRGDILTINECQNTDLFWAMRGGGGSTFSVLTSVTMQAHPSTQFLTASVFFATGPGSSSYWTAAAVFASQYPGLSSLGISGYSYIKPDVGNADLNTTGAVDGYYGIFMLPVLSSANTSLSLATAVTGALNKALASFPPGQFSSAVLPVESHDDFWAWYKVNNGPLNAGGDSVFGSRLLDEKALTSNLTALEDALKQTGKGSVDLYLAGGKGSQQAVPRGGGNAVNDAWRRTVVHSLLSTSWQPFDDAEKAKQEDLMTNTYVEG